MTALVAQSFAGQRKVNAVQAEHDASPTDFGGSVQHGDQTVAWTTYLGNADFWERTLQKPVGAPHRETASSG